MSRKVRFGVLGVAKIAVDKVIPAMQLGQHTEVVAIASRSEGKAKQAADRLGLPKAFGSYEALLADPDIDAIYNPLPNHLHIPWSIRALEAGKHVLCEKPLAPTLAEAVGLLHATERLPGLKVMEAFMYRFHPQWIRAKQIVRDGGIGELTAIQSFFAYFSRDPENVRHKPEWGGGGLLDIGCYPISLSRFIVEREPLRVVGEGRWDPDFGVDRHFSAILDFGEVVSSFVCSMQTHPYQRVHLHGTTGRVEIEIPFNAPPDRPTRIWHETAAGILDIEFPICDQYTLQGDAFAEAVLLDRPVPTPLADGIANMRVIESLFESVRERSWRNG